MSMFDTTFIPPSTFSSSSDEINISPLDSMSVFYTSAADTISVSNIDSTLKVQGNAEFEGNITWQGKDLGKILTTIEERLAILNPDPAKLEKYEALKKAYDHYKLLEKLLNEE